MREPLDRFVSLRAEIVTELKRQGDDDAAKRIAALRKPSIALWALNQASVDSGDAVDELGEAGLRLRRTQERVLTGEGAAASELQSATLDHRRAVDAVARRLRVALESSGHTASDETMRRIANALRTASIGEPETWDALRSGRLLSEPEATSFPVLDDPSADALRMKSERVEQEAVGRRVHDAEATVQRAEAAVQTALEHTEAARQRHQQAITELEEARRSLERIRRGA